MDILQGHQILIGNFNAEGVFKLAQQHNHVQGAEPQISHQTAVGGNGGRINFLIVCNDFYNFFQRTDTLFLLNADLSFDFLGGGFREFGQTNL